MFKDLRDNWARTGHLADGKVVFMAGTVIGDPMQPSKKQQEQLEEDELNEQTQKQNQRKPNDTKKTGNNQQPPGNIPQREALHYA